MNNIDIKELISKVNIVDVIGDFSSLTKAGSSYKTLCNVHGDTTPSLSINPRKQIYKCFVCDHGGDALDYLIWSQKFTYNQALEYLIKLSGEDVDKYNILLKKKKYNQTQEQLSKALSDALSLFRYYLDIYSEKNNQLNTFLKSRNLSSELINKYSLGFAPKDDNYLELLVKKSNPLDVLINATLSTDDGNKEFFREKIIFPIFDEDNQIVAFSGRKIDDNELGPKYINSKESQLFKKANIIYNYHNAKNYDELIIVEGFFDVIAFARIGYDNAIALMGVNLSDQVVKKFTKHKEITIFLDSDNAGINATLKLINIFLKYELNFNIINSKDIKDPDEIVNLENGKQKLKDVLLNQKISWMDWLINYASSIFDFNNPNDVKKAIMFFNGYNKFLDSINTKKFVEKITKNLSVEESNIFKIFNSKPNVIQLNTNKNINNDLENQNKLDEEPINIRKILIWIWKNPSYINQLQDQEEKISFIATKYKKIYYEIKDYHIHMKRVSKECERFLDKNFETFKSDYSLPKSFDEVLELIDRLKFDRQKYDTNYLDNAIKNTNTEEEKISLLKTKQKIISKKIKE